MFNRLSSKLFFIILSTLIIGLSLSGLQKSKKADLVLMNGKIVTVDDEKPEVQALVVSGDRIVAVGSNEEIKAYITQKTDVIDLEGKLADITVLSKDIMTVPDDEILNTKVVYTIVGGKVLYKK